MNRSEGIAMADEQNQGNTIINQGTTIDNLPGLDGMSQEQKQAFIDSAFVRGRFSIFFALPAGRGRVMIYLSL